MFHFRPGFEDALNVIAIAVIALFTLYARWDLAAPDVRGPPLHAAAAPASAASTAAA
jgi:hypothetical protein